MMTENRKRTIRKWDKENMKTISCRLRTYDADIFKEYCKSHNTTPGAVIKKYVTELIEQYCEEQDTLHNSNDNNSTFSDTPIEDESE